MPKFKVEMHDREDVEIEAEYSSMEDRFLVFKTVDGKQVALFNTSQVISVQRTDLRPAIIGSVTVNVIPQIDQKVFATSIDEALRRVAVAQAERQRQRRAGPGGGVSLTQS